MVSYSRCMNGRVILLAAFGFLFFTDIFSYSYAAPVYGTHMPEKNRWVWGIEGDFILDRNLDNEQGGVEIKKYFITGSYGLFKWLCFDGKIGVGDVEWHRTQTNADISYDTNFAGGYGFRIDCGKIEHLGIKGVIGFQHISVHPDAKNQEGHKHQVIIDEWQGSALISKDIGRFIPYLGLRYGTVDFIKWLDEQDRKRIHSEKFFGAVVGMDYWLNKKIRLNLEMDFLDGEELTIGMGYDF